MQRASNAAVCTYWGCGPEPWKRPRSAESGVQPGLLSTLGHKVAKRANGARVEKLRAQAVGYPASPAKWLSGDAVSDNWRGAHEAYWHMMATSPSFTVGRLALQAQPQDELGTIIGHRLFTGNEDPEFQLQCRWVTGDETWEYEIDLQRLESAAVLTYWASDPFRGVQGPRTRVISDVSVPRMARQSAILAGAMGRQFRKPQGHHMGGGHESYGRLAHRVPRVSRKTQPIVLSCHWLVACAPLSIQSLCLHQCWPHGCWEVDKSFC